MRCQIRTLWLGATWTILAGVTSAATMRVPEDHPHLQSAIDAAAAGDTVLVSPGIYRERIRLKPGVTLRSAGDQSPGASGLRRAEDTVIDGGGARGEQPGVIMAADATLDGFTITNVGVYDDELWNQHHATQGEEQSHEHIGQPGIPGIQVKGVTCTVINNIVHHNGSTGIAIQGGGHECSPRVYRNFCYRNMGGGIGSMQLSSAVIEGNTCFQNFYAGIGHHDASPTVINNRCYENIRAGIGISEGACPTVRANQCYRNRRAGIGSRTDSNTRPLIEDNECYQNDMAGIGSEEHASPLIRGNRCHHNQLAGIGSRTGATPLIVDNECYENAKAGIGQESDAVTTLIGNHCHHNKAAGIGFAKCQAGQATVLNNRVIDNALVAVGIHSGWKVHLSGNELSRQGGLPPIVMVFAGAQAVLTNNVIRGAGVAGIRVGGHVRAEGNTLLGEKMRPSGPPNFAFWALPGSHVMLRHNYIQSWRHGLYAREAEVSAAHNQVRDFSMTALVIQQPTRPADVHDNTAISSKQTDQVLRLEGAAGLVRDNRLKQAEP